MVRDLGAGVSEPSPLGLWWRVLGLGFRFPCFFGSGVGASKPYNPKP